MLVVHASHLRGEAERSPDEGDTLEYSARLNVTKQLYKYQYCYMRVH